MQKTLFTIIFIIILLGGFGFFLFFQEKPIWDIGYKVTPTTSSSNYEEQQKAIEATNKKNAEFYNSAMKEQNPKLCEGITKVDKQGECRDMISANQAKKSGNITECDSLTNTGIVMFCRDVIRNDRAITTRNKMLCDKITDADRKSYCQEQIDEITLQENAKANTITKDLCNRLGEEQKGTCLEEVAQIDETAIYKDALEKNDLSICATIKNKELQNTCTNTIYLKTAVITNNAPLCDKITDSDKKLYCQNQVSKNNDITLYQSSVKDTNIENCQKITNINLRNKCNDTIIITRVKAEKNTSLCSSLTNTGIIASCQRI